MMSRLPVYLWAAPATVLGIVFIPLALISGGEARVVDGVIEVSGGLVAKFLRLGMPAIPSAAAMTLGHIVLAQDESLLRCSREHERVHVEQYERWGPLMIPLYLMSSGFARLRGLHPYWDNRFERAAYSSTNQSEEKR